jgi:hypothetical protein
MTDGGYQGNPEVIMPYRKPRDGSAWAGVELSFTAQVNYIAGGDQWRTPAPPCSGGWSRPRWG